MEKVTENNYDRPITHKIYPTKRKKNAFWAGYLAFEIQEYPLPWSSNPKVNPKRPKCINDAFYIRKDSKNVATVILLIAILLLTVLFFFIEFKSYNEKLFFFGLLTILLVMGFFNHFTLPSKYFILNRLQGKVSFPNMLWGKSFTMPFKNIRLGWGGGASGSPTPDTLIIKRPTKRNQGYPVMLSGSYSQELSFLVWYMDKNRPLPPGDAFDEYRKTDYQRRKAEGFPPPIFRSFIETPEQKAKWQKERDRHWRDIIETDEKGDQVHRIWQSAENVARHGDWQAVAPR